MSDVVIEVADLWKQFTIGAPEKPSTFRELLQNVFTKPFRRRPSAHTQETFWALKGVEFEVKRGEVLGVIGRNGAGKSTLLKVLSRITEPTRGHVRMRGRLGSLLEVGTGFHPELTGRENVFLNGSILGLSKVDIQRKFDEIVAFAEVEKFIDTPVKHYSSGMYLRLAFAVAAYLEPDILVVDEVLAVGDAAFQNRCINKMKDVAANDQRTVIFVSHNMTAISSLCTSALYLAGGAVARYGSIDTVIRHYLHSTVATGSSQSWDPSSAPGDDDLRLLSISASSRAGHIVSSTAEDIIVTLEVAVTAVPANLCIGFDLLTAEGLTVLRSYDTDNANHVGVAPGRNMCSCIIPSRLLNTGTYYIAPRIGVHNQYWIVHLPETIEVTLVQYHGSSAVSATTTRPGPVAPTLSWSTATQPLESYV
ncbi:MAG: ATP-binding cassette domain-containing protein [Bryobacterales bacterium]|nr:ATP-binding cassette domain-containing protein [Bryobacterales bacterium]